MVGIGGLPLDSYAFFICFLSCFVGLRFIGDIWLQIFASMVIRKKGYKYENMINLRFEGRSSFSSLTPLVNREKVGEKKRKIYGKLKGAQGNHNLGPPSLYLCV